MTQEHKELLFKELCANCDYDDSYSVKEWKQIHDN